MKKFSIVMSLISSFILWSHAHVFMRPDSCNFTADGKTSSGLSSQMICFYGDGTLCVTSMVSWLSTTYSYSSSTYSSKDLKATKNDTADRRYAKIDFNTGEYFLATQDPGVSASLDRMGAAFCSAGGVSSIAVTVPAGVKWSAWTEADWITISGASGTGSGGVSLSVARNYGNTREAKIHIAGHDFAVRQTSGTAVAVWPLEKTCEHTENSLNVSVNANEDTVWSISSDVDWIEIEGSATRFGNELVTVNLAENLGWVSRRGKITVNDEVIVITQDGSPDCDLQIDKNKIVNSSKGASHSIAISAPEQSTWRTDSSSSWLKIATGAQGTGDGTSKIVITPNTGLNARTGSVSVVSVPSVSEVDLMSGLEFHIPLRSATRDVLKNGYRNYPMPSLQYGVFDGSGSVCLNGSNILAKADNAFSFAFTFKLGELNCINRLASLNGHGIYIGSDNFLYLDNTKTDWAVSETHVNYVFAMTQSSDGMLTLFGGIRNGLLTKITSFNYTNIFDFTHGIEMSQFIFGYGKYPSENFLTSGQITDIRFWIRALTDVESCKCESVDWDQYSKTKRISIEERPKYIKSGTTWTYCPLDGNGAHIKAVYTNSCLAECYQSMRPISDVNLYNWKATSDRFGLEHKALWSNGNGRISSPTSDGIFGKYEFSEVGYQKDATYSFWMRLDSLPTTEATLFQRNRKEEQSDAQALSGAFKLAVNSNGCLRVHAVMYGASLRREVTYENYQMPLNKWVMITLVGCDDENLKIFADGQEVGNIGVTSNFRFGLKPYSAGSILTPDMILIGGWNGALDELTLYHAALTSSEVSTLFENSRVKSQTCTVIQEGTKPELSQDSFEVGPTGEYCSLTVTVQNGVTWSASSDVSWLTLSQTSGTGTSVLSFNVAANTFAQSRTGYITIADTKIKVTQSCNDLTLASPGILLGGDAGSGSVAVSVASETRWSSTSECSWIHIVGTGSGVGNGTVSFTVDAQTDISVARTGAIDVCGNKYYITQRVFESSLSKDSVSLSKNGGTFNLSLTSEDWGEWFVVTGSDWISASSATSGYGDATVSFAVVNNTTGKTRTGYVIVAGVICTVTQEGVTTSTITYTNLRGATHSNPATYQEGSSVTFSSPVGGPAGYTFTGWTPSGITASMTGNKAVQANWEANNYTIAYSANGGSGEMAGTAATYDQPIALPANGFTYDGHAFKGWSSTADGDVDYDAGVSVSNLTSVANGVVTLYAVWETTGGGDTPGGGDDPGSYDPPSWVGVTKSDTMVVYAAVQNKQSGERIATAGSLLAAFDKNGECRGVEEVQEGPFGAFFQLTVGIESTSETGFTLKVWDAATGETTDIATTFDANADKQIGQFFELVVYEIGALSQFVTLNDGWTWISFALTPEDAKIGTLLAGHTFANGDMLKASNKTVTYYNGVWYPSTYELAPGKAYMVKKTAGGAEQVEIAGTQMTDGLALAAGWNWLGSTVLTTQTVSTLTHTGGFANGDQMKSSSKTATWYGGQWYASDFKLNPGNGYVAKVTNGGTLYFGDAPALAAMSANLKSVLSMSSSVLATAGTGKPSWTAVTKGDNMVAYASVHDTSTDTDVLSDGSLLAAFDANGECRGVAEIEEGPCGKLFQLTIGIESTAETGFVIKVWDASADAVYDVIETIDANADKQIGQLWSPAVYTIKSVSEPLPEIVNPTPQQIEDVLEKADDPKLAENITNETDYTSFRTWAGAVKTKSGGAAGTQGVMDAPHAWLSFALGSATLIESAPLEGDLKVEKFEPKSETGKFDFTVSVKDIEVGSAAAADNLKKVFGLEGGTSLQNMSADKVDVTFGTPADGKVKFTAGPNDADAKTFFMKVKLTP